MNERSNLSYYGGHFRKGVQNENDLITTEWRPGRIWNLHRYPKGIAKACDVTRYLEAKLMLTDLFDYNGNFYWKNAYAKPIVDYAKKKERLRQFSLHGTFKRLRHFEACAVLTGFHLSLPQMFSGSVSWIFSDGKRLHSAWNSHRKASVFPSPQCAILRY